MQALSYSAIIQTCCLTSERLEAGGSGVAMVNVLLSYADICRFIGLRVDDLLPWLLEDRPLRVRVVFRRIQYWRGTTRARHVSMAMWSLLRYPCAHIAWMCMRLRQAPCPGCYEGCRIGTPIDVSNADVRRTPVQVPRGRASGFAERSHGVEQEHWAWADGARHVRQVEFPHDAVRVHPERMVVVLRDGKRTIVGDGVTQRDARGALIERSGVEGDEAVRSVADERYLLASARQRPKIVERTQRVVDLSAEERLAQHQREPRQVGLVEDAIGKVESSSPRIRDRAIAASPCVDHRDTAVSVDAQTLGQRILDDRGPRRRLADVEECRRQRLHVVWREQPTGRADFPFARELELFGSISPSRNRGRDAGRQWIAPRVVDAEDRQDSPAQIVRR